MATWKVKIKTAVEDAYSHTPAVALCLENMLRCIATALVTASLGEEGEPTRR